MCWRSLIAASVTGPRFWRSARSTIAVTANLPFVVSLIESLWVIPDKYAQVYQSPTDSVGLCSPNFVQWNQLLNGVQIALRALGVAFHFRHARLQLAQRFFELLRVLHQLLDRLRVRV